MTPADRDKLRDPLEFRVVGTLENPLVLAECEIDDGWRCRLIAYRDRGRPRIAYMFGRRGGTWALDAQRDFWLPPEAVTHLRDFLNEREAD